MSDLDLSPNTDFLVHLNWERNVCFLHERKEKIELKLKKNCSETLALSVIVIVCRNVFKISYIFKVHLLTLK